LLTDEQTDRQTDTGENRLLGRGNNEYVESDWKTTDIEFLRTDAIKDAHDSCGD